MTRNKTIFRFQWQIFSELAKSFGLADEVIKEALSKMIKGAADTMFSSSLTPAEVMDLVLVKPVAADDRLSGTYIQQNFPPCTTS